MQNLEWNIILSALIFAFKKNHILKNELMDPIVFKNQYYDLVYRSCI